MLKAGERAPEFTLPDETGTDRSLTELLSAGAIVLYFYPADFTPGCTRQACALRDLHSEIERAGLRVVGISPQSPAIACQIQGEIPAALRPAVGSSKDRHQNVRRQWAVRDRGSPRHLPDRWRPPRPRCGAGGFQDRAPRGFRAQGHNAARHRQGLVLQSAIGWRARSAAP